MNVESEYYSDPAPTRGAHRDDQVDDLLAGTRELTLYQAPQAGPSAGLAELIPLVEGRKRDPKQLLQVARQVGARLGSKALYRFPVGGKTIEGATVDLIEDLATEYRFLAIRVEIEHETDSQIRCAGVVTDLLSVVVFRRPYSFAITKPSGGFAKTPESRDRWKTMQLQSGTSKAVRTALEHALPSWYVQAGVDAAKEAMAAGALVRRGKAVSLREAIDGDLAWWWERGVSPEQLEEKMGAPRAMWTVLDVSDLADLGRRVHQGMTTVAAEFPAAEEETAPRAPTGPGLAGARKASAPAAPAEPQLPIAPPPQPADKPAEPERKPRRFPLIEARKDIAAWESTESAEFVGEVRRAAKIGEHEPVSELPLAECERYLAEIRKLPTPGQES